MERHHFTEYPWRSEYFYHYGQDSSLHTVVFEIARAGIAGTSIPQEDGSELKLWLRHEVVDHTLTGTWQEKTAPEGEFRGRWFQGAVQFLLSVPGTHASGMWVGFNRRHTHINAGRWTLEQIQSQE